MTLSNNVYDVLKYIAQIGLPALATLYCALSGIWGFPYGEQVVGTIVAINTFLGALLGISNANYKKSNSGVSGTLMIDQSSENATLTQIEFDTPVEDIVDKDTITFKIDNSATLS